MLLSNNRQWETWRKNYYAKYVHGFDCFLKYLYMAELNSWQAYVENLKFDETLANAERFIHDGK